MSLQNFVDFDLLRKFQTYDDVCTRLVNFIPKKYKTLRSQLSTISGLGVDKYAEIFAAVLYESKVLGGTTKGQDLIKPIEVKYGNFAKNSCNGGYVASIGNLKNKTCDLFVVLSDSSVDRDHPLFLRFFYIPYKKWSNRNISKIDFSIKQNKQTDGWYKDFEIDQSKFFA